MLVLAWNWLLIQLLSDRAAARSPNSHAHARRNGFYLSFHCFLLYSPCRPLVRPFRLPFVLQDGHSNGPFLVLVPLSTLGNWEREFSVWAPDMYVVSYQGNADARQIIRDYEFHISSNSKTRRKVGAKATKAQSVKKGRPLKFHVLLTSYEMVIQDNVSFGSIPWEVRCRGVARRVAALPPVLQRCLCSTPVPVPASCLRLSRLCVVCALSMCLCVYSLSVCE